jgi:predicted DNA-binding protein
MSATQLQLSDEEHRILQSISRRLGKTEEELVHEVVVRFLDEQKEDWRVKLRQARGMWKDRDDLPDLRELREEFNRYG